MPFNSKNQLEHQNIELQKIREEQNEAFYLVRCSNDVHRTLLSPYLSNTDICNVSLTSYSLYKIYQPDIERRAFKKLLEAVIDDDKSTVKRILDSKPELLIKELKQEKVESKKTWQCFYAEAPLKIATKRRQLGMVELLLNYFKRLEEDCKIKDGKKEALAQWGEPPTNYQYNFEDLVNASPLDDLRKPSKEAEMILQFFRKTTLPNEAILLDRYFDIENLLLYAYTVYKENFSNRLQNMHKRYIFFVYVIGFLQSLLSPEVSYDFCNRVLNDYYHNSDILEDLNDEELNEFMHKIYSSMYRTSRDSDEGMGFNYIFSATCFISETFLHSPTDGEIESLQNYIEEKTQHLAELKKTLEAGNWPQNDEFKKQNACIIL